MTVRPVMPEEAGRVAALFDEARRTIAALGIDQWQNGYPDLTIAEEDAAAGVSRAVLTDGGEIAGVCTLIPDGEPTYDVIEDGAWLTGNGCRRYMTVHRIAVDVKYRGSGAASLLMGYAEDAAREAGLLSVRVDTHEGNAVMRRMLEKNGYTPCGIIHLADGARRIAYEKRVEAPAGGGDDKDSGAEDYHEENAL